MKNNSCLIIIDVQKGIFKLKQPVYSQDRLIKNLNEVIHSARSNDIKIIYTQHENSSFLKKGSVDWEIIDDIKPNNGDDMVIYKKHPSIFENTNLLDILKREGINRLYIAGLVSNGCVKDACTDGIKKGFDIVLISDAHSTFYKNADKIIDQINIEMELQGIVLKKCSELW